MWMSLLGALVKPITSVVEGWTRRRTVKLESELAVAEAKTNATIERLKTAQEADIAWERTALKTAGWKDEFLLIVFSIPLIMVFIPGYDHFVHAGFDALKETPDWYQWCIGIMVASAYGYRKIADFMAIKKGA